MSADIRALAEAIASGRVSAADFEVPEVPRVLSCQALPHGYELSILRSSGTLIMTCPEWAELEDVEAAQQVLECLVKATRRKPRATR